MSSEKKEFDEKLFKELVDEGRTEGEFAEIAEVSPGDGLAQKGDFRQGCDDQANTSLRLGTKSNRPFNAFCGPATRRPRVRVLRPCLARVPQSTSQKRTKPRTLRPKTFFSGLEISASQNG